MAATGDAAYRIHATLFSNQSTKQRRNQLDLVREMLQNIHIFPGCG